MRLLTSKSGQGLVEYVLLVVFVAIAVLIGLSLFGTSIRDVYSNAIISPLMATH